MNDLATAKRKVGEDVKAHSVTRRNRPSVGTTIARRPTRSHIMINQ
jgi:hypothetical protein